MTAQRPFDHHLSARIDRILIELEHPATSPLRRRWLRFQKLLAERNIPAFGTERRGVA